MEGLEPNRPESPQDGGEQNCGAVASLAGPVVCEFETSPRNTVAAGALQGQVFPRRGSRWDTTKSKYWSGCAGPNGMHRSATAGRVGRSSLSACLAKKSTCLSIPFGPSGGR